MVGVSVGKGDGDGGKRTDRQMRRRLPDKDFPLALAIIILNALTLGGFLALAHNGSSRQSEPPPPKGKRVSRMTPTLTTTTTTTLAPASDVVKLLAVDLRKSPSESESELVFSQEPLAPLDELTTEGLSSSLLLSLLSRRRRFFFFFLLRC